MLMAIDPAARVFTLDTGVLFDETRAAWRAFEERWGVHVEIHEVRDPSGAVEPRALLLDRRRQGRRPASALLGAEAWITGVRREQSPTRAGAAKLEWDERNGLWKVNPLADWTDREVWTLHPRARASRTTDSTTTATRRSAARRAPSRATAATGAGPAARRRNAACMETPEVATVTTSPGRSATRRGASRTSGRSSPKRST